MDDAFNSNLPTSVSQAAVFELIFHNTRTFTSLLRADGTLLEIDRPALELLSLGRDEAVGRPLWRVPAWSPATGSALQTAIARAGRGQAVRLETEVLGSVGHRTVIDFFRPTHFESGGRGRVFGG